MNIFNDVLCDRMSKTLKSFMQMQTSEAYPSSYLSESQEYEVSMFFFKKMFSY